MCWVELFGGLKKPTIKDFKEYLGSKLFNELVENMESEYKLEPIIEYSKCPAAPGWNIKFKKSGKSLCVIYPSKGYCTTLIVIGKKEEEGGAVDILKNAGKYLQELYEKTRFACGGRWLMIDIKDKKTLNSAKELIALRASKPKK